MGESEDNFWMTTNRIETLVDGIFAIAMTLMVLSLVVPEITGPLSDNLVNNEISSLYPKFLIFVISFVLLALFWTIHHRSFHIIKKADRILLWINLIWLLFIVMVPFSQTLIGEYGDFFGPHLVYNLNMLGIAVFITFNWLYAIKSGLIDKGSSKKVISDMTKGCLVFLFVALLAVILTFIIPQWTSLTYILIIPLEIIFGRL